MKLIEADALKKDFAEFYGGVAHAAIAAEIIDKAPAVDCKKCVIRNWCDMVVENGKIIEMTEDELYCTYLDRDLAMCMDFNEYKTRMIAAGTKIVGCKND